MWFYIPILNMCKDVTSYEHWHCSKKQKLNFILKSSTHTVRASWGGVLSWSGLACACIVYFICFIFHLQALTQPWTSLWKCFRIVCPEAWIHFPYNRTEIKHRLPHHCNDNHKCCLGNRAERLKKFTGLLSFINIVITIQAGNTQRFQRQLFRLEAFLIEDIDKDF